MPYVLNCVQAHAQNVNQFAALISMAKSLVGCKSIYIFPTLYPPEALKIVF
jgi:hypothetical protein